VFGFIDAYAACPGWELMYNSVCMSVQRWGKHLFPQIGEGFPGLVLAPSPARHPDFPANLSAEINYLNALEIMLEDPEKKALWWDPIRKDRKYRPPWIRATYLPPPAGQIRFEAWVEPEDIRKKRLADKGQATPTATVS
jgi:hypothetical protein